MARDPIEVPLLDLPAQDGALRGELEAAAARVIRSGHVVLGPEVEGLEQEVAAYCGAGHAVACASGSDAILLCLMALGVGPGHQVLLPSFTFFATAGCVVRLGAEPVWVDIDPATYNVSPATLRAAAERCSRPRVLLPVHLFGQAADRAGIAALAQRLDAALVEDAAQALGAVDAHGRRVGSGPGAACFSFYPTKNLGAYGDGGLVTTDDAALADELRVLRNHGMEPRYFHRRVGVNSRLDALQAALLRVKLPHLERWNEARRAHAAHYDALFREAGASDSGSALAGDGLPLRVPARVPDPARHVFHQYVIRVPAQLRDELRRFLGERRIATEIYYPLPLHLQACFASLGGREGTLPGAERAAREVLALPVHPALNKAQREHVAGSVIEFLSDRSAA